MNDKYLIHNREADLAYVEKALACGKLSGTSDIVTAYEQKLADYFGCKYAIATSSGTASLITALYSVGVREGNEVIVPCTAPIMTLLPLIALKATPVFCDTIQYGFGFDINSIESRTSRKTKAVISVPMWGYPNKLDALKRHCEQNGLYLIEDAAQSHGSLIENRHIGTIGDIGCFSTHDRKILSTGEGGFLLTNRKDLSEKARSFTQFGSMSGVSFGLNFKLSSLQAAIGLARLPLIDSQVSARTKNVHTLAGMIRNSPFEPLPVQNGCTPNYYALVLKRRNGEKIDSSFLRRLNEFGILSETVRYAYRPAYRYPLFETYRTECPQSEKLIEGIFTVPVHPDVTEEDISTVADCLCEG